MIIRNEVMWILFPACIWIASQARNDESVFCHSYPFHPPVIASHSPPVILNPFDCAQGKLREESHRNKVIANCRDSSLRSERSDEIQSMCLFASLRKATTLIDFYIMDCSLAEQMTREKNVILNEVKNRAVGLPFVAMRFFTSFRMTGGRGKNDRGKGENYRRTVCHW